MQSIVIAFILVILCSCASTPPICKPEVARQEGRSQALQGKPINPIAGSVCKDGDAATFKAHFEAGYQEGKKSFCDPKAAENRAAALGEEGAPSDFNQSAYAICDNLGGIEIAFKNGHARGVKLFCTPNQAEDHGYAYGTRGRKAEMETAKYQLCGKQGIAALRKYFQAGYKKGLAKYCEAPNIDTRGLTDGKGGKEQANIKEEFGPCGTRRAGAIRTLYAKSYSIGIAEFCSAKKIDKIALNRARKHNKPTFPQKLTPCLKGDPSLKGKYATAFTAARKQVVLEQCNYQKGVEAGQQDAQRHNKKNTTMPTVCTIETFNTYLTGYLEGWNTTKESLCSLSEAYAKGLSKGRRAWPMTFFPPDLCPASYHEKLRQRFKEGYNLGRMQHVQANADEHFECEDNIRNRSGTHDSSRCRNSDARIACYEEVTETCRARNSDKRTTRDFRRFTGRCAGSYSDCW